MDEINKFLGGRTIGIMTVGLDSTPVWHWRGPGYDEGWEDLTAAEIDEWEALMRLLVRTP